MWYMDLSTRYLSLNLKNPIVASSGPLSYTLDSMKRLEEAGAAAIVMYSMFEEQIAHETAELYHYLAMGTESFAESLTYFPESIRYNLSPDSYVDLLFRAKNELRIPLIGSLNGISVGGWIKYAKYIEDAGADALELNVYYIPTDPHLRGSDVEQRYLEVLSAVREVVRIPIAMKLSPYFSSMAHMAHQLENAGADGLVLFNRFYQPDIDLNKMEVTPNVILSTPYELRLPMRWIAILRSEIRGSLAATSGIHSAEDILKMLMVGADVTMMCSALLLHGPEHITGTLQELEQWMAEHEYSSVRQMQRSMCHRAVADPAAFERANYMKALHSFR